MKKQNMKSKILDLLAGVYAVIILLIAALATTLAAHWCVDKLVKLALHEAESNAVNRLEAIVDELPPGNLKSNMYTVLAAEYGGDGDSLQEHLKAYAEMKIKELQARDSL